MCQPDATLETLLVESLRFWRVPARVTRREGTLSITGLGAEIVVARAAPGLPFRWMVTVRENSRASRQRPALSVVSVLRQVRLTLDPAYAKERLHISAPPAQGLTFGTLPSPSTGEGPGMGVVHSRSWSGDTSHPSPLPQGGRERARRLPIAGLPNVMSASADRAAGARMIPVTLLTGFLGSGKTTLLSRALRTPEFARTAVVINEFGEIGLDHELVAASDEQFVSLTTGCLCCKVQSDLVVTLEDMLARREAGSVLRFERVVIETSGLADPAPILHALMTTPSLLARLSLSGVVTTIDAVTGAATLAREPVSAKQAAVADRLILTKTDLTGGVPAALIADLDAINPGAERVIAAADSEPGAWLLPDAAWGTAADPTAAVTEPRCQTEATHLLPAGDHLAGIVSYAITRERPLAAVGLTLFLEALAEHAGADLLRLKGLVAIAEARERPAVVHGVQHVFHPPVWLDRWPSNDRRSRLVFITRSIPRAWVEALLAAIEAEVADVGPLPAQRGGT